MAGFAIQLYVEYQTGNLDQAAIEFDKVDYVNTVVPRNVKVDEKVFEAKPNLEMRFHVEVPSFKPAPSGGGYIVTVQDLKNPSAEPTQLFARTLIDCTTSRMGSAPPHKPMIGDCPKNIYPVRDA